jgi:predicted RNA methylase
MLKKSVQTMPPVDELKNMPAHEQYGHFNAYIGHDLTGVVATTEEKKAFTKASATLDKYYTKPSVASACMIALCAELERCGFTKDRTILVEPSAGSGVFMGAAKSLGWAIKGFDLAPSKESVHEITQNDFLTTMVGPMLTDVEEKNGKEGVDCEVQKAGRHIVFVGNPPFGKKASLAIEFTNRALSQGSAVGYIVPLQFRKWSVQSKIEKDASLVLDMELPENAFEFMGKDYGVRCCFQVWVTKEFESQWLCHGVDATQVKNLRIQTKPPTDHADFDMYQFNRTEEARKFFDYAWDFAVPRQGYQDYTYKAKSKSECDQKQQWIFFKAKTPQALSRLLALDYEKLSKKNIGTPGFGKADVILAYESYTSVAP